MQHAHTVLQVTSNFCIKGSSESYRWNFQPYFKLSSSSETPVWGDYLSPLQSKLIEQNPIGKEGFTLN